jgi:hypothetical protein
MKSLKAFLTFAAQPARQDAALYVRQDARLHPVAASILLAVKPGIPARRKKPPLATKP